MEKNYEVSKLDVTIIVASLVGGILLSFLYLSLQQIVFGDEKYLIFISPPSLIFASITLITPITLGFAVLHIVKKYNWTSRNRILKLIKRFIGLLLLVSTIVLTVGIFDYAGISRDGVYYREFPHLLTLKKYSWDEVKRVDISMHKTLKQGVWFNYVLVFTSGNAVDLWVTDDISPILEIDKILSNKDISFEIGTLEESELPPVYQNEIEQIRWIFRKRH